MILVGIVIAVVVIFAMIKHLMITETIIIAVAVGILIGISLPSEMHLLFKILLIVGGIIFACGLYWGIFSTKIGFWIMTSILSIGWGAFLCFWFFDGTEGDMIWTVFGFILGCGGSFGLHIYAKNNGYVPEHD